jgi:hypothetical protein
MEQKTRKRYSPEFKAQAVELLDTGKPVSQLAEELCISSNLLYKWRQDSQGAQGGSVGPRAEGEGAEGERLEPVDWQEGFELLGGRVVHELFKHPLKIGERVGLVAADLFDEGVDDRTAPAGVLTANQHPVHVSGKKMCKTNYPKSSKFYP